MALIAFMAFTSLFSPTANSETICYKLTLKLKVPRVYDNMQSRGYRKVQRQTVYGYISVNTCIRPDDSLEPMITTSYFVNNTHKVSGSKVTYTCGEATDVMWRFIGSNKTRVFKKPNVKFSLDLDPSYNVGYDEPDNALIVTLSGYGSSCSSIKGSVTGQIGCGCKAYGHVSPTRTMGGEVSDIVPLCGQFVMKRVSPSYCALTTR